MTVTGVYACPSRAGPESVVLVVVYDKEGHQFLPVDCFRWSLESGGGGAAAFFASKSMKEPTQFTSSSAVFKQRHLSFREGDFRMPRQQQKPHRKWNNSFGMMMSLTFWIPTHGWPWTNYRWGAVFDDHCYTLLWSRLSWSLPLVVLLLVGLYVIWQIFPSDDLDVKAAAT